MKAQVAPLEGNKVKLSVEVEETEVEQAIDETFAKFSRELRVPGFRPGKAPRRVLEARIGRPAARHEALEQHIPLLVWPRCQGQGGRRDHRTRDRGHRRRGQRSRRLRRRGGGQAPAQADRL